MTTTALALSRVWPQVAGGRRVLLADCDPAGGDLAAGYLRGAVEAGRGLLGLAARRGVPLAEALAEQLLAGDDAGRRLLLPGLPDPAQAPALAGLWPALAALFTDLGGGAEPVDVLVDLGRLGAAHDPAALRRAADLVVVVTRASLPTVAAARTAVRALRGERDGPLGCLVVADGGYPPAEVAQALGVPLLAALPTDRGTAAVFSSGAEPGWGFARSPLLRAARAAVPRLLDAATGGTAGTPDAAAAMVGDGRGRVFGVHGG